MNRGSASSVDSTSSTFVAMQEWAGNRGQSFCWCLLCFPLCSCWWIPLLFFSASKKVSETCGNRDRFVLWMRINTLGPYIAGVSIALIPILSTRENLRMLKLALRMKFLAFGLASGLLLWGWVELTLATATPKECGGDFPLILSIAWLTFQSACSYPMSGLVSLLTDYTNRLTTETRDIEVLQEMEDRRLARHV